MDSLDQALPPGSSEISPVNGDPLVGAARRLAEGPDLKLSDAALDRIEARLRARTVELHTAPKTRPNTSPRPVRRPIRTARVWRYALVASLVLVLVITSVTRASAQSLPGDRLYSVKRALEDGRLALVTTNGEPKLRISLAERRTGEFEGLLDRNRVYPRSLEEANSQINRALDLLAQGHGDWKALQPRIIDLVHEQDTLLTRALPLASVETQTRLQVVADQNRLIINRVSQPTILPPANTTPLPIPTVTATDRAATATATARAATATPTVMPPSPTNTAQPTPTATTTPTPTSTRTPVPSRTPTPSSTQSRSAADEPSNGSATRTPPGHGATPGLGNNPPGQGGDHPGIGNDGRPPGQSNDGLPPGQQKPKKNK
jgi:hypothetical protein